jgi:bacteriorhodopsin
MTFFDWQSADNRTVSKSLWVYFAVTIPITILVLAAWTFLTKKNRQENSDRVGVYQMLRRRTMERGHDLEKND